MFNHLRRRLLDSAAMRQRRHHPLRRFRGQIEPLESRSMLSASIGMVPAELVVWPSGDAAGSEREVAIVVQHSYEFPFGFDTAREISAPIAAAMNGRGDVAEPDHEPWSQPLRASLAAPPPTFPVTVVMYFFEPPSPAGGSVQSKPPLMPQSGTPAEPRHSLPSTNPVTQSPTVPHQSEPLRVQSQLGASGAVTSYLSIPLPTSTVTNSSSGVTLGAYLTAFEDYSPQSLLLSLNVDRPHDGQQESSTDDLLGADDTSSMAGRDIEDLSLGVDVVESLDALRGERAAIDTVLSELHSLELPTNADSSNREKDTGDGRQLRDAARDVEPAGLPTADESGSSSTTNQAEGGMVLLEATGDANSSAYDLTAVYLTSLDNNSAGPLGVEASVGMYQAFDVGTSETRSKSREDLPTEQPAATTHPGVSAENAPAKKSDQPT